MFLFPLLLLMLIRIFIPTIYATTHMRLLALMLMWYSSQFFFYLHVLLFLNGVETILDSFVFTLHEAKIAVLASERIIGSVCVKNVSIWADMLKTNETKSNRSNWVDEVNECCIYTYMFKMVHLRDKNQIQIQVQIPQHLHRNDLEPTYN